MTSTPIPKRIIVGLDPALNGEGFSLNTSKQRFLRKTESGFHDIRLVGFSPSRGQKVRSVPLYEGGISLGIRFDAVDERLLPVRPVSGPKNQAQTVTACRAIHGYFPFKRLRDRRLLIRANHVDRDIMAVTRRTAQMLKTDGLDWFRKFATLEAFEQAINVGPWNEPLPIANNLEHRILTGIVASGLCKGQADAIRIADLYLSADQNLPETRKGTLRRKADQIIAGL